MLDYSTFLIDLDGVVFSGDSLCEGAGDFVRWLEANRRKYLFLTNSSAAGQAQVAEKLRRLGIGVDADRVIGAGEAAVLSIARRFPGAAVYLVGEPAMVQLLVQHGLTLANETPSKASVVLCCLDRAFDYAKLAGAVAAIRGGAAFITANRDPLLPVGPGRMAPGCGAIAAAIEAATGVTPEVVGKPQPTLFIEALRKLGSPASDTLMIGDNLNIDVLGAHRAGLSTLLVLSGVSTLSDLAFASVAPDHIYPHLGSACADLQVSGALRPELNNT
jgi:HAD superfamily hydrolase (TIGR01450 family)